MFMCVNLCVDVLRSKVIVNTRIKNQANVQPSDFDQTKLVNKRLL